MIKKISALTVLLSAFFVSASAETGAERVFELAPSHDPALTAPNEYLGYALGTNFTRHHQVLGYLQTLASESPRLELYRYGKTWEGRDLVYVVVSSPGNMEKMDVLRKDNLLLADPSKPVPDSYYENAPIFVWLSYNVHGNEASSTETAMAAAYHLAADTTEALALILANTVVIIDPSLNPDGRERYVNFFSSRSGSRADAFPGSWEHREPWPSGRYNHYLFDLNRDWSWLTQVESRRRVKAYMSWLPQVHVDFHEMYSSSSYFFFPPAKPMNPNFPLKMVEEWDDVFGKANAEAFDKRGWPYFEGEEFDLFYPGYGDSWPTFHGATGMTYEQAGHSRAGLIVKREDRTELTLADRINHHFIAGLTTIETASSSRSVRLRSFREFFEEGLKGADKEPVKEYLLPPGDDPARAAELAQLLIDHGIEVLQAESELKTSNLYDYEHRKTGIKELPAGTYIIPLKQPLRRLAKALMEPETDLPDTFFYDITAWSLPLAYGLDAYASPNSCRGSKRKLHRANVVEGGMHGGNPRFGYIIPWKRNGAPKLLAELLDKKFYVRAAGKEFTMDGRRFEPGALILPRAKNSDSLDIVMKRAASDYALDIYAAAGSRTQNGIDLGSNRMRFIKPVKVALVGGEGTSQTSFGAAWFLLDREYGLNHSVVELNSLRRIDLDEFDVIILPDDQKEDGLGKAYTARLDSCDVTILKRWVEKGGIFIGLGGGAVFACADHAGLSSIKLKKKKKTGDNNDAAGPQDKLLTLEEKKKKRDRAKVPGAIFKVKLDKSHPLSFGYDGEIRIIKTSSTVFEPSEKVNTAGYFTENARVSGFVSEENERFIAMTPYLVEEKVGKGHVVLYVDDPNFRMFWYGLTRLFLNSIFFMPAF